MKIIAFITLSIISMITYADANTEIIYATYNVEAEKSANLAFSYSGIIDTVLVDVSSKVKKGTVLATLQNDDLIASENILKITLKYALLNYERHKELFSKKLIDKALLDKYALAFEQAKAQIKYQKTIISKTLLKAPFDGIITDKKIDPGDVVSGQLLKAVFKIQSEYKRKIIIEFDQKYHHMINVGDRFEYKLDGNNKKLSGLITKIYPYINVSNRKMKAEVFANNLTVGLYGEGNIIINSSKAN